MLVTRQLFLLLWHSFPTSAVHQYGTVQLFKFKRKGLGERQQTRHPKVCSQTAPLKFATFTKIVFQKKCKSLMLGLFYGFVLMGNATVGVAWQDIASRTSSTHKHYSPQGSILSGIVVFSWLEIWLDRPFVGVHMKSAMNLPNLCGWIDVGHQFVFSRGL